MRYPFPLLAILVATLLPGVAASAIAAEPVANPEESGKALEALKGWLASPDESRGEIAVQPFANAPLTKPDAERARAMFWEDHLAMLRKTRAAEVAARVVEIGGLRMKFELLKFGEGDPPADGRSLFISMHGGGGAPPPVNESQWVNQVRLGKAYAPHEGIYLAPRAPSDTWDLWHRDHIDGFFARLIEDMVAIEGVNPNRVYLMGYSAGGDGVYQVGPRMADRWAAAAMMGGHPNEASPLGLRNIGFAIQVGANDGAYNRNKVAAEWGHRLDDLEKADPGGYPHFTELHAGKGHWMDLEDRKAIPWMEKFTRKALPEKVAWHQDDVIHADFYWLGMRADEAKAGQELVAERKGQQFIVMAKEVGTVFVRLNDAMADLDAPVRIRRDGVEVFDGRVRRTIGTLARTLAARGDHDLMFSAEVPLIPAK